MAKKFVRTITDTKLKGKDIEPLITNKQNDLLSDEHDVYVRNKDYYHCLTNAIQKIESKNDSIVVSKKDKNTVVLEYTGDGGGGGTGEVIPVKLESLSKYIDVEKIEENHFQLSTEQLEIELEEIRDMINNIGGGTGGNDYLGDYNEYDFEPIKDNNKSKEVYFSKNDGRWRYDAKIPIDVGKFIIRTELDYKADIMEIAFDPRGIEIEKTAKKNIYFKLMNTSDKELSLMFVKPTGVVAFKYPRTEDDLDYINGSIKIQPNSFKEIKTTFYTDPDGDILRVYLKEM